MLPRCFKMLSKCTFGNVQKCFCKFQVYENVIVCYPSVIQVYIYAHQDEVVQKIGQKVADVHKCTYYVHFHTKMCKNVIQVYENVIQVYIFAHKNKGVQKGGKCSAMYFNLYSTFSFCFLLSVSFYLVPAIIISTSLPFIRALRDGPCHISAHFGRAWPSVHRCACPAASC